MNYKLLGRSGLAVSPVCLGTMMFGGRSDDSTAARIVGSAQDAGINFIDTADVYNDGKSERVVGRLIRKQRDHWVLATKGGNAMGPGPNERGLGRRWLMRAVEGPGPAGHRRHRHLLPAPRRSRGGPGGNGDGAG